MSDDYSSPAPSYDSPSPPASDSYPPRETEVYSPSADRTDVADYGPPTVQADTPTGSYHLGKFSHYQPPADDGPFQTRLNDAIDLVRQARADDPEAFAEATKAPGILIDPSLIHTDVTYTEVDDDEWRKIKAMQILPQRGLSEKLADLGRESTLLESGQTLFHHAADDCSGSCCLHGTSEWPSCKWPRSWHSALGIIHFCGHGQSHPCEAGRMYRNRGVEETGDTFDTGDHTCDQCCNVADGYLTAEERDEMSRDLTNERLEAAIRNLADLSGLIDRQADLQLKHAEAFTELCGSVGHIIAAGERHERQLEEFPRQQAALAAKVAQLEKEGRGWWWKWPMFAFVGVLLAEIVAGLFR